MAIFGIYVRFLGCIQFENDGNCQKLASWGRLIWKHKKPSIGIIMERPKVKGSWVLMKPQFSLRTISMRILSQRTKCCRICKFELHKYTRIGNQDKANKLTGLLSTVKITLLKMKILPKQTGCWLPCLFSEGVVKVNGCYQPTP